MRVDNKPSVPQTRSKDSENKPKKSFADALARDREPRPELAVMTGAPGQQPQSSSVTGADGLGGASPVETVRALADEIVEIAGVDGLQQLEVEVDSKVIGDLRISVSREPGGDLEIRLMTDSSQTASLLQQNLGQLTAALTARNVQATAIQVTPRAFASSDSASERSRRERAKRERDRR